MENISKEEKERLSKIINEKSKDVVYGNQAAIDFTNVPEETKQEAKEVSEKIQFELDKRAIENKTKEQLIEDLKDLYDLFELKSSECESLKKKLNDTLGDVEIYKNEITEKNKVILFNVKEKEFLEKELEFENRMNLKLDEIIKMLITK